MIDENKAAVRRWVDQVLNGGDLDVLGEIYVPRAVDAARRWIAPFRTSFPDVHMEIIDLVAEDETVVGRSALP